jgi:hypothetical protein
MKTTLALAIGLALLAHASEFPAEGTAWLSQHTRVGATQLARDLISSFSLMNSTRSTFGSCSHFG